MKINIKFCFLLFIIVSSVACITNRDTRLLQKRASMPEYESMPYKEYRLKPNDELNLFVISLDENINRAFNMGVSQSSSSSQPTVAYRIYGDGTIDIPFTDSVYVAGLTITEAASVIEDRLKGVGDNISVKLQLANNNFYMMGNSGKGSFPIYKDRLTIYQAIASAGFSPGVGNLKKVNIIREQDGKDVIVTFDLRTESVINSEYFYVQPNDVIYVETTKGNFFRLQSFTSVITLISSSLTFLLLLLEYTR